MDREKTIVRTGMIGVLANVLLAAFKAAVGLLSHYAGRRQQPH